MFKDILLPVLGGEIEEPATRQACLLAARMDATVHALVAASAMVPATAAWVFDRKSAQSDLASAAAAAVGRYADAVARRLAHETIRHEVRAVAEFWYTPAEIVIRHAPACDLIVLGVERPLAETQRVRLGKMLVGCGRPLLVVPATAQSRQFDHVLVAWKDTREATRALRDAMPILAQAQRVEVLLVGQEAPAISTAPDSAERLLEHLRLHGVAADITRLPQSPLETGWTIADHALATGADVIVAGGYSHARAMQQVFGGVTRYLLESSPVPVLLSH